MFAEILQQLDGQEPGLGSAVLAELRRGWQAEKTLARVRQARIAEATRRLETCTRPVEGLGQPTMRVTPEAYHYWGNRLGYDCWRDKQFIKEFQRDNPEVRVRTTPRTTTIIKDRELPRRPAAAPTITTP